MSLLHRWRSRWTAAEVARGQTVRRAAASRAHIDVRQVGLDGMGPADTSTSAWLSSLGLAGKVGRSVRRSGPTDAWFQ